MKTDQPLVSIIVPIYNAEKYLDECIESIVKQDVGFADNIELLLINDGSVDESANICEQYQRLYPNNVVYIKQNNAGVSAARNRGIDEASGKFIGFIDADDCITLDAVRSVMNYFKTAPNDVDVAIIKVILFGEKNAERPINKKFQDVTRTVDLNNPEWFDICPRVAPSFIKSLAAKSLHFDENISFYEDSKYINEILLRSMKLGVVSEGIYYNRKMNDNDDGASITTGATRVKRFYIDSPEKVSLYLLRLAASKRGTPSLYIQYLVLYEMRWRLFYNPDDPKEILTEKEYDHYQSVNTDLLLHISNEAIAKFKLNNYWQRLYLLNQKNNINILDESTISNNCELVWKDHVLFKNQKHLTASLTDFYLVNNKIIIKGFFNGFIGSNIGINPYLRIDNNKRGEISIKHNEINSCDFFLEREVYKQSSFVARIPLSSDFLKIEFMFSVGGEEYKMKKLGVSKKYSYRYTQKKVAEVSGYIVRRYRSELFVCPDSFGNRIKLKLKSIKKRLLLLTSRLPGRNSQDLCLDSGRLTGEDRP